MAVHKGSEGVVKVGSDTVAEVTGFSFDETSDTIETTALSNSARSYVADYVTFSGTVDCMWDETDTSGQGAMTAGSTVTLNLYPEGSGSGATYYTGSAVITSISRANAMGSVVTASFSFQGANALSSTTV
tara:strand:- start:35 stop:424 length:390 start_codon:yes stop_codon:yes gene_type:complete